jgi:hypothetical protein
MKCLKYQFENPDRFVFCGKCGGKLEKTCQKCNFFNPLNFILQFLADKILTKRSAIEGEWKLVTVLFADAANFTAISEKLDPEEFHQVKRRIKFVSIQNALAD